MPAFKLEVFDEDHNLPAWSGEGAALLLSQPGLVAEAETQWHDSRRAKACGGGLILAFLIQFFAQKGRSLRAFSDRCSPHRKELAALIGRRKWMTQSALSKALSQMTAADAENFCEWLLLEGTPVSTWQSSDAVAMRDTRGEAWHLFDIDPTAMAQRQRALPEGEDLPEAKRLATGLGRKGYLGRKRGELICSRVPVQHAGTGLWLGNMVYQGNADTGAAVAKAAELVRRWCLKRKVDIGSAVLRFDGGMSGGIGACTEASVHFVTRTALYQVLGAADVQAQLAGASWHEVPDSKSGPRRAATELGLVDIGACKKVRVVVTRFLDEGAGAGHVMGRYRYELFATSLKAANWPAPELVALYYQRSGAENQFACEDREAELDRPYSYSLPGFQIVTTVGLYVWNLRTEMGASLYETSRKPAPAQKARKLIPVNALPEASEAPPEPAPLASLTTPVAVVAALSSVLWPGFLRGAGLEGWAFVDGEGLRCWNEHILTPRGLPRIKGGTPMIVLRAKATACRGCPFRTKCSTSTKADFRREVHVPAPRPEKPLALRSTAPEWTPPGERTPGRLSVAGHYIRAAKLRDKARVELAKLRLVIKVPRQAKAAPEWWAEDPARRQNRRMTYEERRQAIALNGTVRIAIKGPKNVAKLLMACL